MSDNKLLAENTIRRFMKLANTETLSDNFVTEMYGKPPAKKDEFEPMEEAVVEEEETLEEAEEEELEMDAELGAEDDMEDMADMEKMGDMGDMDAEPELGAADMSLTEEEAKLLISLGERLAAAMEGAGSDEEVADMGEEEPAEAEEEDEEMMGEELDQDALVNEVLKRVTKRLVAEKLKNRK